MIPSISVLISTYNNRRFVEKKLREIISQSIFQNAEFIFIETASPEREREDLAPFCQSHANCKMLTTDDRKTLYEAWNLGWETALAPLICFTNMDDCMHPLLLQYVLQGMVTHPWDACSVLIGKQNTENAANPWCPNRLKDLPLSLRPGPFIAWRSELKNTLGCFDGRFNAFGDKDFWSRMISYNLRIGLIKKVLYLYTKGPSQLSKFCKSDPRFQHDLALQLEKEYPTTWSRKFRWSIFWRRYIFRFYPYLYTVKI